MDWLNVSTGVLTVEVIAFRLFCSLIIGLLIGLDRELTYRPAGLRTHMLVALGACAVMLIGQLIFEQYHPLGATPDPARMAAQVVAGVGFLGAGTIMREGNSVRGLTTAAGVWAVACLGMAVGGGYYAVALIGTVGMLITLVVFEWVQNLFMRDRHAEFVCTLETEELNKTLQILEKLAGEYSIKLRNVQIKKMAEAGGSITFQGECTGHSAVQKAETFRRELLQTEHLSGIAVG